MGKMDMRLSAHFYLALVAVFCLSFVTGLSPVEVKGAKLFTSEDGNQFFVRGTLSLAY